LLNSLFKDKEKWWNNIAVLNDASETFSLFIDNIALNFGAGSTCYNLINSDEHCAARRDAIACALMRLCLTVRPLSWYRVRLV
jgi:hypothetical protein